MLWDGDSGFLVVDKETSRFISSTIYTSRKKADAAMKKKYHGTWPVVEITPALIQKLLKEQYGEKE